MDGSKQVGNQYTTALTNIQRDLKSYLVPFVFIKWHLNTLLELPPRNSPEDNLKLFNELHHTQALVQKTTQTK